MVSEREDIFEGLKEAVAAVNRKQEELRHLTQETSPAYIAHGTHLPPENFQKALGEEVKAKFPDAEMVFPKFTKETQNELDAIKAYSLEHPEIMEMFGDVAKRAEAQCKIGIQERIFGIPTKTDADGKPVFDEQGRPEPQDGTFAYALKKCSACIGFTESGVPLLVGFEDKYKNFETGKSTGHIYVLSGESFKPEYTEGMRINEYTSLEYVPVVCHREVSPKDAMLHGAQFVMFDNEKSFGNWMQKHGKWPSVIGDETLASLAGEIEKGKAAYINETSRGVNPLLKELRVASVKARVNGKVGKSNSQRQNEEQKERKVKNAEINAIVLSQKQKEGNGV